MVLIGTEAGPEPNRRSAFPSLPRIAGTSRWHDQSKFAAVRRLAYEASDSGLLSPELAAGIRRVKGVKQLRFRTGN